MRFLVSTADDIIGRQVFSSGGFELPQLRATMSRLHNDAPDRMARPIIVDVGANIGTTTVAACTHFGFDRAIAIEPDPENAELLRLNVQLNGLSDRVTVHQLAVSDHNGALELLRAAHNSGDHRVALLPPDGKPAPNAVRVKCSTLDGHLRALGVDFDDVGLLWIDAQGHEGHIMAGAQQLAGAGVPAVLEFWPRALEESGGLDLLLTVVTQAYSTAIDMGPPYLAERGLHPSFPAHRLHELVSRYPGDSFCDVILLP